MRRDAGSGLCQITYNSGVDSGRAKTKAVRVPPSVVFALAFASLGWIAGHSIAYEIVGLSPDGHHRVQETGHHHGQGHDHPGPQEPGVHGYMDALGLTGGVVLVLAFVLALRAFFRHGSFGEWLREGGRVGTAKQVALSVALPAAVFVVAEYAERMAAGTGTVPPAGLLVAGVFVQFAVGLVCLALVRLTFRVAERVFEAGDGDAPARRSRRTGRFLPATTVFARSSCPMADRGAGRAPPLFSV